MFRTSFDLILNSLCFPLVTYCSIPDGFFNTVFNYVTCESFNAYIISNESKTNYGVIPDESIGSRAMNSDKTDNDLLSVTEVKGEIERHLTKKANQIIGG